MKRKNETAVAEMPTEYKKFQITYPYFFKGQTYNVIIGFFNKPATDLPPELAHLNGFYEITNVSVVAGDAAVHSHFTGEVLQTHYRRKMLNDLFEAEIQKSK